MTSIFQDVPPIYLLFGEHQLQGRQQPAEDLPGPVRKKNGDF
jgi:hypothetical protein